MTLAGKQSPPVLYIVLNAPANDADDVIDVSIRDVLLKDATIIRVQLAGGRDATRYRTAREDFCFHGMPAGKAAMLRDHKPIVLLYRLAAGAWPAGEALILGIAFLHRDSTGILMPHVPSGVCSAATVPQRRERAGC